MLGSRRAAALSKRNRRSRGVDKGPARASQQHGEEEQGSEHTSQCVEGDGAGKGDGARGFRNVNSSTQLVRADNGDESSDSSSSSMSALVLPAFTKDEMRRRLLYSFTYLTFLCIFVWVILARNDPRYSYLFSRYMRVCRHNIIPRFELKTRAGQVYG